MSRALLSLARTVRLLPLLAIFLFALMMPSARAATLTVTNTNDSGSGSLRAAIATANTDGGDDTIHFSLPSTIYPQITLSSTLTVTAPMTIVGAGVPNVVIDGGNGVRVFSISGGTTVEPVALAGLTIAHGNSLPSKTDYTAGVGGGIYNAPGDVLTLTGCIITDNTAPGGEGGGLFNDSGGTVTLTGCTLSGNSAAGGAGGGLYNGDGSTVTLTGCNVAVNSVNGGGDGGGLFIYGGTATLTGCTLHNNSAQSDGGEDPSIGAGGGLCDFYGTVTLTDCTLTANRAANGGGVDHDGDSGGTVKLTDCTLIANSATYGGAIAAGTANSQASLTDTLTDCTLTANSATISGGGVFINLGGGSCILDNNILYGDTAPTNNEAGGGPHSTFIADYCDIGQSNPLTGTAGNIDADPLFANFQYDVTLTAGSPCIGAGDPAQAGTKDIKGIVRFNPPTIGAHEGYSLVVTNANADGDGSLSGVLLTARSAPDAVVTFSPVFFDSFTTITPTARLELSRSVEIIGPDAGVAVSGGNSQGIFLVDSGVQAILTGLTLTGGNTSGGVGGGVDNFGGAVALTGCTLTGNTAAPGGEGGGLYNGFGGTAALTGCTLTGNSASFGGGLYNDNGGTATLTGCALTGNTASGDGGGIGNGGTGNNALALTDCTLTGNTAFQGGAIVSGGGTATLTNCTLAGNGASGGAGGGILLFAGAATVTDCTLTGNSAQSSGGGVSNLAGTATLDNNILYGDTAPSSKEISGSVSATYCDIGQGGYTGTGDISADPLFVGPPGNLQLPPNSPCIGAGDPAQAGTYDILGTPRPNPPSIGAYEGTPAATRTRITSSSNASLYGQSVTFIATVANASPGSRTFPAGSVEFYVNGIPAATVSLTNVRGAATAAFTTSGLEGGTEFVTASLLGNAQFTSSSSDPLRHDVGPASTSTAMSTFYNPTIVGQPSYFGVTVTNTSPGSSAVPTGNVAFYLNGSTTPFDTEPLGYNTAGFASTSYTFTKVGTYVITAKYLGDSDFTGSTGRLSPDEQVNPGVAISLTLTAPPTATAGRPFQATVQEVNAFGYPVTDPATVTFASTDARAALPAPVSLTNGTATVTVTDYSAGSQTLTAYADGLLSGTAATAVSSDPQGAPNVSVNAVTLTRTSSTTVTASFTLVNTGVGAASAVKVTVAKLGTVGAASLPAPVSLGAGQSQAYSLTFTGVPPGATTLTLNGTYTGTPRGVSTGYAFSGGKKVTVP